MSTILKQTFFDAFDTLSLAKNLLGKELVLETPDGIAAGIIVETEAYLFDDKACHAYGGETTRNSPMFGQAGTAYIYLIYGIHHCFNIVSGKTGTGEAILIRALEPTQGIELMKKRRKKEQKRDLCSGPGKLVQALGIEKSQNRLPLIKPPLYLKNTLNAHQIHETTRIGIGKGKDEHLPYRFYIKDNKFVSKP